MNVGFPHYVILIYFTYFYDWLPSALHLKLYCSCQNGRWGEECAYGWEIYMFTVAIMIYLIFTYKYRLGWLFFTNKVYVYIEVWSYLIWGGGSVVRHQRPGPHEKFQLIWFIINHAHAQDSTQLMISTILALEKCQWNSGQVGLTMLNCYLNWKQSLIGVEIG